MKTRSPTDPRRRLMLLALPSAAALAACGGGGDAGPLEGPSGNPPPTSPGTPGTPPPVQSSPPKLSLLAGSVGGFGNLDGPAAINRLNQPGAVVVDAQGNTFIADTGNHAIRKLDAAGVLSTVAGLPGYPGSADGKGSEARFASPAGIALDGAGGLFVADSFNHTIRRVAADGTVTTVAGKASEQGLPTPSGVVVDGAVARFSAPIGLAFDGQFLYIADRGNHAIRRLRPDGGVELFAGSTARESGPATAASNLADARFNDPYALAFDGPPGVSGTLWISDMGNHAIRKVPPGGSQVFTATAAAGQLGAAVVRPLALAVDHRSGEALVFGGQGLVYRVGVQFANATVVEVSSADEGFADGLFEDAQFDVLNTDQDSSSLGGGVVFDAPRLRFVVADAGNHLLRSIDVAAGDGEVRTIAGQPGARQGATNSTIGAAARFRSPISLAPSSEGAALVGELMAGGGSVRRIESNGRVSAIDGVVATGVAARFVAEAPNGEVYVSDGVRAAISRAGTGPLLVASPSTAGPVRDGPVGAGRFGSVRGMSVDGLGRAIFADAGAHAVRYLTPNGTIGRIAGRYDLPGFQTGDALEEALFDTPIDVAIAPDDTIYVLDVGNLAVLRIAVTAAGRQRVTVIAANFEDPRALALDAAGNLYVAEAQSHTIVRISKSGERKTVAGVPDQRGFAPGILPGALALPARSPNPDDDLFSAVGMRVVGNRLLLTMEQAVVQITPLPA